MFASPMRLFWPSIALVAVAAIGCSSLRTFSDPISSISLRVGESLWLEPSGALVITLVRIDPTSRTAHFKVYDTFEVNPSAPVEFQGDCSEGDLLTMSPDLRRGYCRLIAIERYSVRLSIFGGTSDEMGTTSRQREDDESSEMTLDQKPLSE